MAAWLPPFYDRLRFCLAGPAEQLFNNKLGALRNQTLEHCLDGAELLISGTGWSSDLEHKARAIARRCGIPCVAVLDHWVNYRTRFQRGGVEVLPHQLWVADAEAKELAQSTFPELPVLQLPNYWLDNLTQSVSNLRQGATHRPARRLLYLLEPIRLAWVKEQDSQDPGEFQALDFWISQLPLLANNGLIAPPDQLESLCLRPHPSEDPWKYKAWISAAAKQWPIKLDSTKTLESSLAWADAVFGCETQALVAALACGIPAISTLPPWAPLCSLPQQELIHLSLL